MRVLMSAQVREDYRKRKREEQEGTNSKPGEGGKKKGKVSPRQVWAEVVSGLDLVGWKGEVEGRKGHRKDGRAAMLRSS